ncbi:uncharacterized protein LTR77_009147 [Saxophila tyrrhenica]|uniref:Spindle pole body component n=1 Tax=Saxophila tyrrhenica TaxID=1690608 RepID=A0AAV9P140_9PEZI|nr:hypothetical protein LTR77_009147 [Saxophila tyrrhenica]
MLHEVLLALSGHPSPLFSDHHESGISKTSQARNDFPLLTPSEKALLASIGQLSELHRKLRRHVEQIAVAHSSTICRAVATSIQEVHLARFQDHILEVESKILTKDAAVVGAYDIVPLAGVVGEFDDWHRRMAWYWDLATFMLPSHGSKARGCTGASLIDRLRAEMQTGFEDIEQAALELSRVAETAWLRQASSWVLYGKVPTFGASDFFVKLEEVDGEQRCSKDRSLLPKFASAPTASSILFIGKSLLQVRKYGQQPAQSTANSDASLSERELVSKHLQHLSALSLPIVSSQLSRAISSIRLSLSQNVLQHLLPMEVVLNVLSCIKQFMLLERGEFAVALINEADNRLQVRQQSMGRLLQQDPVKALKGLSINDAEFQQTLLQVWKRLATQDEDIEDEVLDFAEKHVTLSTPDKADSRPSTSDSIHEAAVDLTTVGFNDLLFPSAVILGLNITQPLDLFITSTEVKTYSSVNAYLLSLKRAHVRLADLWRRTVARRDTAPARGSADGQTTNTEDRQRFAKRRTATRKVWATCSAAIFLLSETSAYFEGEIVRESWSCFERWVRQSDQDEVSLHKSTQTELEEKQDVAPRDPESLAAGHRAFLASLVYVLLLNDIPYTKELRSLLGNVDNLIAFFKRLLDIQQKLDMEHDAGGETGYTAEEEARIALELDRARKKVDSDLRSVVNRLKQLDQERIGSGRYLSAMSMESGGFEPWKGGGVDRLLMKLEFGRMTVDEYDLV